MSANSNNGYRFWRTCLSILTISFLLISCADDESVINYRKAARGFWEAISEDLNICSGPAIAYYNWYAIDTTAYADSVAVTWDDGRACTTTIAVIVDDEIFVVVDVVEGVFKIHDNENATVTFQWGEGSCVKSLEKIRDDPQVFCF